MNTPVPIQVTRHQCPHCRRTWAVKQAAARHITRCWRNPEVRSCKSCGNYCPEVRADYFNQDPGEPEGCSEGITWEHPNMPINCASWGPK